RRPAGARPARGGRDCRAASPPGDPDHPWPDGHRPVDEALDWVADTGIMAGVEPGVFAPERPVTRHELAGVLFRLEHRS
ncbi:MAG: S-layer homology domain-containing protein, partial [Actinomycetota bacterium]